MVLNSQIKNIIKILKQNGYEAYAVGGCVRDLLMGAEVKDWDLTTNARPDDMMRLFPDAKYENDFGTVLIPIKDTEGKTESVVEVTTYRSEQGYSDRRHPDRIRFEDKLENDLGRRDFTVNSLAWDGESEEIVDLFGGRKDIAKKIIRAVGEPEDRFKEDALRMMRAVRFSAQLGFSIEEKTARAIVRLAGSLKFIAKERIHDELVKILESNRAYEGIMRLYELKLLQYIMPELLWGEGVGQSRHHKDSVLDHNLLSLKFCPSRDWRVRLASLWHDIGKPRTKAEKDGIATFYNHEYAGERIARKIMDRLHFSAEDKEKIALLIRNHMFYYNTDQVTASSVRRLIRNVGKDNLRGLIDMRIADRLGSGAPKAKPYKLRHLEYMFEKVQNDPVSVKMLKLNGDQMIAELGFEPGIKMGAVLDVLLSEVIEDPELNNQEYLAKRSLELKDEEIEDLRKQAREKIMDKREKDDSRLKRGHYVK